MDVYSGDCSYCMLQMSQDLIPVYWLSMSACFMQAEDEYMLSDTDLFVNRFISVPKDLGNLNCAAFVAGILKGVLQGAGFPARSPPPPPFPHPSARAAFK